MKTIIGLDAGHGGSSSGTYSINTAKDGLFEKDYCLELVKLIGERLEANGFEPFYTRTTDTNPGDVSKRAKMCVDAGCSFAVSIHFNGFENASAKGTEVFVPYREEVADIEVGFYNCLTKYFKERKPFARSNNYYDRNETFDKKMNLRTKFFDASTNKKDYFGFIRTCWDKGVSADLLEICFLTNKEDFGTYVAKKEEIASGIAKAIVEGFNKEYKEPYKKETVYRVQVGAFKEKKNAQNLLNELRAEGYNGFIYEDN